MQAECARLEELVDTLSSSALKMLQTVRTRVSAANICSIFNLGNDGMEFWRRHNGKQSITRGQGGNTPGNVTQVKACGAATARKRKLAAFQKKVVPRVKRSRFAPLEQQEEEREGGAPPATSPPSMVPSQEEHTYSCAKHESAVGNTAPCLRSEERLMCPHSNASAAAAAAAAGDSLNLPMPATCSFGECIKLGKAIVPGKSMLSAPLQCSRGLCALLNASTVLEKNCSK